MRWTNYFIFFLLLYVMTALQLSQLGKLSQGSFLRIEYIPLLGIFYALFADDTAAPLCGLFCGLAYDLISPEPMGLFALPLALVCLGVVKIRLSIFREHLISQLLVAVLAILAFALLAFLLAWFTGALGSTRLAVKILRDLSINAIYSGVIAPGLFWLLLRMRSILGFDERRGRGRH